MSVKHWSVDEKSLGSGDSRAKWELENRINFGIGASKISKMLLKVHWEEIDIDPWKRKALALALE